ncbi:hypothetical protein NP493_70g05020 [Ridgeia piscesae]|uniref:Uncharacterized protein n=1 Tax=Ridgeia piscesae TaxID=27915 RepID=A0AAD9P9G0_RIDPI|nr:hypothetical protein NP493_70g05020 [Ridgeia piscesae]
MVSMFKSRFGVLLWVAILLVCVCTIASKSRKKRNNRSSKREVTKRLQQFHDKYARQPMTAIDEARPTHTQYTNYLADKLRGMGLCSRVEYTGSAYEGVKVSNDIEFDIMVIKAGGHLRTARTSTSGYYYLKERDGSNVSPDKTVSDFKGKLQKVINKHPDMSRLVKLRNHGPAIQMDVYRSKMGTKWYSVDIVLSYEINIGQEKHLFVGKPLKSDECIPHARDAWRRSYSLEEKSLFSGMDRDNGCRKKVLRILKVWRNREAGMYLLTSYHLKTALFYEMEEGRNWNQSELGPRLIGVFRRLYRAMIQGRQPHYFVRSFNLLDRMKATTVANIRDRLESMLRSEQVFFRVFEPTHGIAVPQIGAGCGCNLLYKREVTKRLQQFHDKYARQPMTAIDEARPTHTQYTNYLADKLRGMGLCSRVEYTGSAYEGVKVSNDIEFDIMVIKAGGHLRTARTSTSGYYYLKERDGSNVSPDKTVSDFKGKLQKVINKHPDMSRLVKLRNHGPAIQMDVYRSKMGTNWYSVDIVLSYEINIGQEKHLFVGKPLKSDECIPHARDAWRRSYSLEEKSLFSGMDRDNRCRKKVLRILKVWRNREAGMYLLTSYHLKTALFHEATTVANIRDRLESMLRSEQVFFRVFEPTHGIAVPQIGAGCGCNLL